MGLRQFPQWASDTAGPHPSFEAVDPCVRGYCGILVHILLMQAFQFLVVIVTAKMWGGAGRYRCGFLLEPDVGKLCITHELQHLI